SLMHSDGEANVWLVIIFCLVLWLTYSACVRACTHTHTHTHTYTVSVTLTHTHADTRAHNSMHTCRAHTQCTRCCSPAFPRLFLSSVLSRPLSLSSFSLSLHPLSLSLSD